MKRIKETEYFSLHALHDGVYAAIAKAGQGAWSNAGIVDLGDDLLVFDSFATPSAGYALRKQAEDITGKKVTFLLNSHYHGDHVFGNQAFIDTTIISTSLTKELSEEKNKVVDLQKEIEEMEEYLNNLRNQIEICENGIHKAGLLNQFDEMSKVLNDLPDMKMVLPQLIFEDKLIFEGPKRKVELHCWGGGHTPSDTFMYLPEEKTVFMGDLVTKETHLPIHNPEQFKDILEKVKQLEIEMIVPGHGSIGTKELLFKIEGYIKFLIEKAREAISNNVTLESFVSNFDTPDEYSNWKGMNGINRNLNDVYKYFKK